MEHEYSIGVILENISLFLNVFPILSTTILLTAVQIVSTCTPNTFSKKQIKILPYYVKLGMRKRQFYA